MPGTTRAGLAALLLAAACDGAPPPAPAAGAAPAAAPITARGVELRLPRPGGGDLVIRGDVLALGPGRGAALTGNVRIASAGGAGLVASAARATIADGGRIAVLEGGVRAALGIGSGAGDAGPSDE